MVPTSVLFAYFTVGLASGLPSLGATYVMVNVLGMNASGIANVALMCSIPWCLKPVIAAISDKTRCFCGYRRRPYVSFFSLLCGVVMIVVPRYAEEAEDATKFVACWVCISTCICVVDVCLDGSLMVLVAEEKKEGKEGTAQGKAWAARVAGTTLGAGWSGTVYSYSFMSLMFFSAFLPVLLGVVALDIPDEPEGRYKQDSLKERVREYNDSGSCSLCRIVVRALWACRMVLGAAILVAVVPEINTSLFFYMLGGGAEPEALSMVEVAGSVASLGALIIYNASRPSHVLSFGFGILLNTLAALVGTFMANDAVPWLLETAAVEAVISSTASILCLMPTITVLGSYAASTSAESTVYSTGLSILNLSGVASEAIASVAMARLGISKNNVNSVRVFVGVVAVLSLTTLPSALCFPPRRKKITHLKIAHPGLQVDPRKLREQFTLETSDSGEESNTPSEPETRTKEDEERSKASYSEEDVV